MSKSAEISQILYWYEGLAEVWYPLGASPPAVPLNTELHLAIGWVNTGTEGVCGHIALVVDKPDGVTTLPVDAWPDSNQDLYADPGGGWTVLFEPILLDQAGDYRGHASISETGGAVLGDSVHFYCAQAGAVATDMISAIMPLILVMMLMGMMLPMMKGLGE